MFPLGGVLFPYAVLPLHVFEPRYRALTEACLAGDGEFGVVLIERGSEVGGGDTRFEVGTVARIVEAGRLPDGRYVLATVGTRRLRVREWLPEEPYPARRGRAARRASDAGPTTGRGARPRSSGCSRRVLALQAELGERCRRSTCSSTTIRCAPSFEAAALAPLGPLDAQRLLELDSTRRAGSSALDELLEDAAALPRAAPGRVVTRSARLGLP